MSHIWMSHFTHINEACHTYEWVMSHIWMSQGTHQHSIVLRRIKLVTQINKCCPTDANITWRLSFFPQTIQACRIGVSHVTHKRHVTHISNMSHVRISCVTPKQKTGLRASLRKMSAHARIGQCGIVICEYMCRHMYTYICVRVYVYIRIWENSVSRMTLLAYYLIKKNIPKTTFDEKSNPDNLLLKKLTAVL